MSSSVNPTDVIMEAEVTVRQKYNRLAESLSNNNVHVSESKIRRYIKQLKAGAAAGHDGITAEHIKSAINTSLPLFISDLFSMCLQYGQVPDSFRTGLLVPIIKKANIDPALPKYYRPITISVVLSKLLEHYVLEKCSHHEYSKFQFGFVPGRNTTMATSFVHDICEYCTAVGSTVFLCSLDTEGAYNGIPHSVFFDCARNILPDDCWRILYNWYTDMSVHVKWQNLGSPIPV